MLSKGLIHSYERLSDRAEGKPFVCFKTIYRWLYMGRLAAGEVKVLRHKGKRQKPVESRGRFLVGTTMYLLPELVCSSNHEFVELVCFYRQDAFQNLVDTTTISY